MVPPPRGIGGTYTTNDMVACLNKITPDYIFELTENDGEFYRKHSHYMVLQFRDEEHLKRFAKHLPSPEELHNHGLELRAWQSNTLAIFSQDDGYLYWRLDRMIKEISQRQDISR